MVIAANRAQMTRHASDLKVRMNQLERYESSISEITSHCAIDGRERSAIVRKLKNITSEINAESSVIANMSNSVYNGIKLYEQNEKKLSLLTVADLIKWGSAVSAASGVITGGKTDHTVSGGEDNKKNPFQVTWKDFWKGVSKAGAVGAAISAICSPWAEDETYKKVCSSLKNISSLVGGVTKLHQKGASATWKDYIGWTDALDGLDTSSMKNVFKSSMTKQMDDLSFSGAKTTADKVKVGSKWAGHVVTIASNLFENFDEMKTDGISLDRAIGETAIESVVDIGMGMVSTALATAVLGTIGAPAVAVGIGSVFITWAANGVCKWVTEKVTGEQKDLGETVADGLYYLKEKGTEVVNVVADTAKTTVKNVGKAITEGLSTGWKGICNVFA